MHAGDPVSVTGVYVDLDNGICRHLYGFDEIHQVENIYGTPYDDTLVGSALGDNVLNGEDDDTFIAYDGYDIYSLEEKAQIHTTYWKPLVQRLLQMKLMMNFWIQCIYPTLIQRNFTLRGKLIASLSALCQSFLLTPKLVSFQDAMM